MKRKYLQPDLVKTELAYGSVLLASQGQWGDNDGSWRDDWNG